MFIHIIKRDKKFLNTIQKKSTEPTYRINTGLWLLNNMDPQLRMTM